MNGYDSFGYLYDVVVGSRPELAQFARKLVKRYAPHAKSLLEFGCGSGSLLEIFSKYYQCDGIDLSKEMLKIAKKRAPKATLAHGDICSASTDRTYDAVVCLFDTINHLPSISEWRQVFINAGKHLNEGGVFIFDVNTPYKMKRYHDEGPVSEITDTIVTLVDVRPRSAYRYLVRLTAFEPAKGKMYRRRELVIPECAYESERILKVLKRYFRRVTVVDAERERPGPLSEELFFVCREPFL